MFGKSGVTLSGSPLEVITDSLANAEMDISIDKYNSEVAARGFETEAKLTRLEAKQQSTLLKVRGATSFISAAADVAKTAATAGSA